MVPEISRMSQSAVHSSGQGPEAPWVCFCSLGCLEVEEMVLAPGTGSWCLPLSSPESFGYSEYPQHALFL